MSDETGNLSDDELYERIEALRDGPHTLERAADYGLLAIMVPQQYGGFGANYIHWNLVLVEIGAFASRFAGRIGYHTQACNMIRQNGTSTQRRTFLPQLASGKRIGINATKAKELYTAIDRDVCHLTGWGVPYVPIPDNALMMMQGWSGDTGYYIVVPSSALTSVRRSRKGFSVWTIQGATVPADNVLFWQEKSPTDSTAEWEVFRWGTKRDEH